MRSPRVVVLDYGSGNVLSASRALTRVGGEVTVTSDIDLALTADGLVVPGVGAFAACMQGLESVSAPQMIDRRLAGGQAVLGICVGMQVLFDRGVEHGITTAGLGQWPGDVVGLPAKTVPHMGWNTVDSPTGSAMFDGLHDERFYFVHSYAALTWTQHAAHRGTPASVSWAEHGAPFVAGVEDGPLWATQFHPEKSGDAGAELLRHWLDTLR
ncbi:MAG: imidazole glycerol phosphate synthase subunit HisH [Actinomycetes bacterium]